MYTLSVAAVPPRRVAAPCLLTTAGPFTSTACSCSSSGVVLCERLVGYFVWGTENPLRKKIGTL
eukprot:COSAG02_NODE_312_length_24941_cov_60.672611_12_plen_64_part_00